MTHNQINYWNLEETKKHNRQTEQTEIDKLAETSRHNRATEGIDLSKLTETNRHNLETERQGAVSLNIESAKVGETQRHNMASERIDQIIGGSTVDLNRARADLANIQSQWESIKSQVGIGLDEKKISQIDAEIKALNTQLQQGWISSASGVLNAIGRVGSAVAQYVR